MSTLLRTSLAAAAVVALAAGCGDKVPQSEAAKNVGAQPKAVVDKATTDVSKALQAGADARKDAEEKK